MEGAAEATEAIATGADAVHHPTNQTYQHYIEQTGGEDTPIEEAAEATKATEAATAGRLLSEYASVVVHESVESHGARCEWPSNAAADSLFDGKGQRSVLDRAYLLGRMSIQDS